MFWIILTACAFLISILESTTFTQIDFFGIKPDLFFIFAVLSALNLDLPEASLSACLMGLCKDLLSQGPLGMNASFFVAAAILIGISRHKIYTGSMLMQLLIVLAASIVYRGCSALLLWFSYGTITPLPAVLNVFAGGFYTAALASGPYFLFKRFRPLRLRREVF